MLLVNLLNNVKSELYKFTWNGKWNMGKIDAPQFGNISLSTTDENSDNYFFYFTNFLEPSTLFNGNAKTGTFKRVKSLPSFFSTDNYKVELFKATSKDGTQIPNFVVSSKETKLDGKNPTLLYAFGGFEISMLPSYNATTGTA